MCPGAALRRPLAPRAAPLATHAPRRADVASAPAPSAQVDRDAAVVRDLGVTLLYALNTHCHADHVTGTFELKKRFPACKSVIAAASGAAADVKISHGDTVSFGAFSLQVRATPGHTDGCVTYVLPGAAAFTGDALLIRGCGRTDFQQGNAGALYDNVHTHILSLPDETRLYVGHDYNGRTLTTVGEEKRLNARLTKTRDEFIALMANLGLPYPKRIDVALPANLADGAPATPAPA